MISILLIFIISISFISIPLQKNEKNYSLLVVMDEAQIDNNNYQEAKNTLSYDCGVNSSSVDECSYSRLQNILSISINPSENIDNIISELTKTNYTINSLNSKIPKNENLLYSTLNDKQLNEKYIRQELPLVMMFLIFHIILLIFSIFYIVFCLIFSKKFILKNVNAKKCNDPKIILMVNKLCREIKIKVPKLYVFDGEPNAFIFGYPISLVISKKLISYLSVEELEVAIRHELGHLSNKDHLLKPLLQTMRIMFFYNPIVHVLYYTIMKERQLLADSKFINSKVDKIRFMETLLKISEFRKNRNIFLNKLYGSSSFLLVSQKMIKLKITDRYNQLFSAYKKRSFFTALICIIVLLSNISMIAFAQNNFLKDIKEIDEELKTNINGENFEDFCSTQNIKTIYILTFTKQQTHLLDIIELKDTLIK
jgi:beta-lactamase regulating signal transducer with metallopeptidase domain